MLYDKVNAFRWRITLMKSLMFIERDNEVTESLGEARRRKYDAALPKYQDDWRSCMHIFCQRDASLHHDIRPFGAGSYIT